jgi:type II secretory pathway component PulM
MERLRKWFQGITAHEQRTVLIGLAAAGVVLLVGLLVPLERRVARLEREVQARRADLAWLQSVAPQLGGLRAATASAGGGESLVVLVDRVARGAGLAGALSSQADGTGQLNVRLEHVAFDALVAWVAELVQHHGVRVISASIDAGNSPGLVSASFQLAGP